MKKIFLYILLFVLLIPITWKLYGPGYYNMHDDLQVMRLFEMERCFDDGQIPCRWAPDMSWGYGQAMFNYYSAFPYYLGVLIRKVFPIPLTATVLTLFNLSLVLSAVGMYLLASKLWGKKGGLLSAVLYSYAPYHAVDIAVRGALAESYALTILPFLWHSILLLTKERSYKNFAYATISIFLLLTTHNISTMIYFPITLLWVLYCLSIRKSWKSTLALVYAAVLGVGLSSFFFLPILFERNLIQSGFLTIDYLNYEAHFVTIKQLFIERKWGYGPSIYGPVDDLSFQIGWPHWLLILPLTYLSLRKLLKKEDIKMQVLILGLVLLFLFVSFLTHLRSIPIWKTFTTMSLVQFPWRFLGPAMFLVSLASGALIYLSIRFKKTLLVLVLAITILLNYKYFEPWKRSYEVTDEQKLSGLAFDLQRRSAILDYLPVTAPIAPKEGAIEKPVFVEGEGFASNFRYSSNQFFFDAEVYKPGKIQIPVMDFPKWVVTSGGKIIESKPEGKYGLITINLPEGKHIIQGRFVDTPIRTIGNTVTLISFLILFSGFVYYSRRRG